MSATTPGQIAIPAPAAAARQRRLKRGLLIGAVVLGILAPAGAAFMPDNSPPGVPFARCACQFTPHPDAGGPLTPAAAEHAAKK